MQRLKISLLIVTNYHTLDLGRRTGDLHTHIGAPVYKRLPSTTLDNLKGTRPRLPFKDPPVTHIGVASRKLCSMVMLAWSYYAPQEVLLLILPMC